MIETALQATLATAGEITDLVGDRIMVPPLDQGTDYPAITWQVISGQREQGVSGEACSLRNVRVQIDCWDKDYLVAKNLAVLVQEALLAASAFRTVLGLEVDFYEPDVKVHRAMVEFSLWQNDGDGSPP